MPKIECVDERAFLVCETLFAFAVHYTRVMTKIDFGYELTMKFGNPFNLEVEPKYLLVVSSICVFFGWFSDSIVGKWYVALLGMLFAILSCLVPVVSKYAFSLNRPSYGGFDISVLFMMAYLTTAGVRNAILLEQVGVTTRIASVRRYLFWLTMLRVWTYNVVPLADVVGIRLINYDDVLSTVASALVVLCFLYFLAIIHKLYTEPTYFLAWEKCLKCMAESIVNRIRRVPKRSVSLSGDNIRSVLKQAEEESKQKKHVRFKSLVQFKSISYGENLRPFTLTQFWGYHAVSSPKRNRKSIEKKPSVEIDVVQPVKSHSSIMTQFSSIFRLKTKVEKKKKKEEEKEQDLTVERRLCYDLFHAHSSEYAVDQTEKFLSCLVLILTPFLFTLLIFTILTITEYQVNFVVQPENEIDILAEYNFYFDAILFPIFYFLLHPLMTNVNVRDWHYVFIGYLFLLFATFSTLLTQLNLESSIVNFPQIGYGSIRLYNSLDVPYNVRTSWESRTHQIEPFESTLFEEIPLDRDIKIAEVNGKDAIELEITEKQTVSYIITKNGINRNSITDPTLDNITDRVSSSVFLVTNLTSFNLVFEDVFRIRSITLQSEARGKPILFIPDKYLVRLVFFNKTNTTLGKVEINGLTLYSYFLAMNSSSHVGLLTTVGGPKTLRFHFLLFQLIFLSLANVITSACFYTIVFLRAPEKLRGTVFSIIFAINLSATATFKAYLDDASRINVFKVLISHVVLSGFLTLWQLAFSANLET